MQAEQVSS